MMGCTRTVVDPLPHKHKNVSSASFLNFICSLRCYGEWGGGGGHYRELRDFWHLEFHRNKHIIATTLAIASVLLLLFPDYLYNTTVLVESLIFKKCVKLENIHHCDSLGQ